MSSDSTQCVFQLKLDPTGDSEWVVIDDGGGEDFGNSNSSLLATTLYLDMLNDSARNRAYREAIDKTLTKPCHVLDAGAGTGLLSMMAARAMGGGKAARAMGGGKVTSCESYLPMAKLMRKVLHVNGMGKDIKLINKRSDELEMGVDIPSRADVLLVESSFLRKLHDLRNNETEISDGIRLVPNGLDAIIRAKSQQHPLHCDSLSKEIRLLSKPFEIFEFDFWRRPESHGEAKVVVEAIDDGRANGVVSWWVLQLDREGTIFYSTAPKWIDQGVSNWCDHWKQCVWLIPDEGIQVSKGEEVVLHAVHDETSVSYNVVSKNEVRRQDDDSAPHLILPPERIALHGDIKWRSSMSKAVENALEGRVEPLCIVADDSVFLTLLAARLSETSRVVSLFPGLRDKGAQYLETVAKENGIAAAANRIEVVNDKKNIALHCTNQKKVDLLLGEPYYHGNEGMLPWQNLRFWKDRTILDPFLSENSTILPRKALLKACAMSLPDLWNSRRSLAKIEGFDHSIANSTLGACGELPTGQEGPLLPFLVWQCGETKELSKAVTVMEFDFTKPIASCRGEAEVSFVVPGICHGFVLWMDWVLDASNSVVISTGPDERYWKQGVKLLSCPVPVGGAQERHSGGICSSVIEAEFDQLTGELVVKNDFC
ncbi:Protein arginine N-methyltransferase 1.6 [Linum perenne]